MEEEFFERGSADQLTSRIADRLGEREAKLKKMAEWERTKQKSEKRNARPLYYLAAIAACIVAAVLLWPTANVSPVDELDIDTPTMTAYRAASPEIARIEKLMSEENYAEALKRTEKALRNSDLAIYELENVPEIWGSDEEMAYEDEAERMKNSELRWTYIFLLIKNGQEKQARKELKKYLKFPEYCEHEEEARLLLKKLK